MVFFISCGCWVVSSLCWIVSTYFVAFRNRYSLLSPQLVVYFCNNGETRMKRSIYYTSRGNRIDRWMIVLLTSKCQNVRELYRSKKHRTLTFFWKERSFFCLEERLLIRPIHQSCIASIARLCRSMVVSTIPSSSAGLLLSRPFWQVCRDAKSPRNAKLRRNPDQLVAHPGEDVKTPTYPTYFKINRFS